MRFVLLWDGLETRPYIEVVVLALRRGSQTCSDT